MIYLNLFLAFLKVGCFSFGGAYGAIPLIRDVVLSNGWITDEKLTYMIAVSESTPGLSFSLLGGFPPKKLEADSTNVLASGLGGTAIRQVRQQNSKLFIITNNHT